MIKRWSQLLVFKNVYLSSVPLHCSHVGWFMCVYMCVLFFAPSPHGQFTTRCTAALDFGPSGEKKESNASRQTD